jgi:general secretion pathway protein H
MLRRARAFTLIELLVVVTIVAVVAAAAVLSIDLAGSERTAEREARRLLELTRLACERANSTGRDYGLHAAHSGYAFSRAQAATWLREKDGELRERALPEGFTLELEREGHAVRIEDELGDEPPVVCAASGELSPFHARVVASPTIAYEVRGEIDGALELERVAATP